MLKNKLGDDSTIPKSIHLKIRRRDGVESLATPEEGEFKVPIGCINDKVMARSALIRKLVGTGWEASPSTLRTSALALVYAPTMNTPNME